MTVSVGDPARPLVHIEAVCGNQRSALELPLYPPTEPFKKFLIADGRPMDIFQKATADSDLTLGEGNGDGYAAPGEAFAVLIPDGTAFRAAELFTRRCLRRHQRARLRPLERLRPYRRIGQIHRRQNPPRMPTGPPVHLLARVVFPNAPEHKVRYYTIEFPVWYRRGEEPKGK